MTFLFFSQVVKNSTKIQKSLEFYLLFLMVVPVYNRQKGVIKVFYSVLTFEPNIYLDNLWQ